MARNNYSFLDIEMKRLTVLTVFELVQLCVKYDRLNITSFKNDSFFFLI